MNEVVEKIGGSLLNLILGALILWVGQTTLRHAGVLATLDQRFTSVDDKFASVNDRYEGLRTWLDKVVNGIKDDSRMQFSVDDAEKLAAQLKKLDDWTYNVERRLSDRVTELQIKLAAVEARENDSPQLAALQAELAQLRLAISQATATPPATPEYQYQTASGGGAGMPVYLPPVNSRR